jgi:gamma-glutamyl hercynylcysteine S-oxide synthase
MEPFMETAALCSMLADARERTFDLVGDLSDEQLLASPMAIVNPLLWEIGHVAWFQERWVLRHCWGREPIRPEVDALYDSMAVPHDTRWSLPLYSRKQTLSYMRDVRDAILEGLEGREATAEEAYFVQLSVFHEDMHGEAFTYTRQTYGWPAPAIREEKVQRRTGGEEPLQLGDVEVPGGRFLLGAEPGEEFVFDNEKWAHEVEVSPYRIARYATTQAQFLEFVEAGGYREERHWSPEGWAWRAAESAEHPVYWRRAGSGWERRLFDRWIPLEADKPVVHVNWFEADAFCRWAGRRLPTEAEWEWAAACCPDTPLKRRFPWGDERGAGRAHTDGVGMDTAKVHAYPDFESAFGCRQMMGNVWEWTSTVFGPYPGFVVDPYKDYSQPWFGDHMVLRGGAWPTRSRMLRNTWRNFYKPDRRDVWSGFRTCEGES